MNDGQMSFNTQTVSCNHIYIYINRSDVISYRYIKVKIHFCSVTIHIYIYHCVNIINLL